MRNELPASEVHRGQPPGSLLITARRPHAERLARKDLDSTPSRPRLGEPGKSVRADGDMFARAYSATRATTVCVGREKTNHTRGASGAKTDAEAFGAAASISLWLWRPGPPVLEHVPVHGHFVACVDDHDTSPSGQHAGFVLGTRLEWRVCSWKLCSC